MVQTVLFRILFSDVSLRYEFHWLQAKSMEKACSFPSQITVHYTALGTRAAA